MLRALGVGEHLVRRPVRRHHTDLMRDAELLEEGNGRSKDVIVALAAHDDADQRICTFG